MKRKKRRRPKEEARYFCDACGEENAPLVRFSWNTGVEVSVPADCLGAIRCLAECLQHTRAERPDAFRELVVRS